MASDQLVSPQNILDAELELKRRGIPQVLSHLEHIEPDLLSYLFEHGTIIHQQLMALGGRAKETQRAYLAIQDLLLVCLLALRQASLSLWQESIAGSELQRLDEPGERAGQPAVGASESPPETQTPASKALLAFAEQSVPAPVLLELLYAAERIAYGKQYHDLAARCRMAIEKLTPHPQQQG